MNARVGRVATLGDVVGPRIRGPVRVDLLEAVRLVVVLAVPALEAGVDLRPDADPLSHLDEGDLGAHPEHFADDLVADGKRVGHRSPVPAERVHIAGANTAALDLDVDIVVAKRSGLPTALLQILPFLSTRGLEAAE